MILFGALLQKLLGKSKTLDHYASFSLSLAIVWNFSDSLWNWCCISTSLQVWTHSLSCFEPFLFNEFQDKNKREKNEIIRRRTQSSWLKRKIPFIYSFIGFGSWDVVDWSFPTDVSVDSITFSFTVSPVEGSALVMLNISRTPLLDLPRTEFATVLQPTANRVFTPR